MGVFWIHLTTLVLLLQTSTSKLSSVGGETTKADLADMSDVVVVNGTEGRSVTFPINSTGAKAALLCDDKNVENAIVTVNFGVHPRVTVHGDKLKDRVAVSEDGRALIISQLRMEDAGIYYFKINKKTSTFILQVFSSDSSSSVGIVVITVLGALVLVLVVIFLCCSKSRELCLKGRCRSSTGHRIASDNQAEESDGQPGADQPLGATQHYQNFPLINLGSSKATNTNSLPDQVKDMVKTHEENNMGHRGQKESNSRWEGIEEMP